MNAPGIFPNEPIHRLQEVLFPAPARPPDLYLQAEPGAVEVSGGTLACLAGTRLDFGTWFNSFYLGFWSAHAQIRRLILRLSFHGALRITVELRRDGVPPRVLARQEVEGAGEPFVLPLPDPGEVGRLALLLDCLGACRLVEAAFCTDVAPAPVRLSIGICTFNREEKLRSTLDNLARIRATLPELIDIILVNQGDPLATPETRAALDRAGARLIHQPNLGGAGGFTRGLDAACSSPGDPTHHLLMDDDIALDPRMIRRLVEALAYARPDRALGGAMLETERPRVLHEAGARLQRGWGVASFGTGRALGRQETLGLFDRVARADYNGWWFCAVPMAAVRRAGLPLPLFIRGDDIEYGCRLGAGGVASVTLPGCAVWHDAFAGKARPWLTYYDYRNLLVNAALHPQVAPPPAPVEVLGALFARLLCHQYGMAAAVRQAVSDYLAGPGQIDRIPLAERHTQLSARFSREDGQPLAPGTPAPPPGPARARPQAIGRVVALFLRRFIQISRGAGRGDPVTASYSLHQITPAAVGPGPYVRRADPEGRRCLILSPHRARLWWGALAALALWLHYLLRHRAAARRWRDGASALAEREAWARRFAGACAGPQSGDRSDGA
ncbi:glycosyltransferase [Pseudooceanicola marinus]|uniref:glycosyltransferase n=1 Tax=Pseudooceanicola marinus TaxID=396013 RepID=UPI001CD72F3C|nr:glycosyltransferase [Pseudooceanicola marinus]MCA1335186.1 glycosyltransferase [Pseudooceanicola marinus]